MTVGACIGVVVAGLLVLGACLGLWLSLPCAWLLHADALNLAIMVFLGWRGSYFLNRLIDNLIVRQHADGDTRQCHICQQPYQKDFMQRLDRDFCSYRCWFHYLRDQRRAERSFGHAHRAAGHALHRAAHRAAAHAVLDARVG